MTPGAVAWWAGPLGLLAAVGYVWLMSLRNRRIVRPPLTDAAGRAVSAQAFRCSDGEVLPLIDLGNGPAVLFVPGADGVPETFRFQIPAVAEAGYRAICPGLRARFSATDTLDRMVADLAEVLESRSTGPAVVVGQSLGGAVAMRLAVREPERVAGLVLANTLARVSYGHVGLNRTLLTPLAMGTTRYLPTVLARLLARLWSRLRVWIYDSSPGRSHVIEYALWEGPRTVPPSVSSARVARLKPIDLRPQLSSITAPTLVVKGPQDTYTPPAWAQEIAALIPGARYQTVPGTGHCSHISMPDRFNRLLLDWLAETVGRVPALEATE